MVFWKEACGFGTAMRGTRLGDVCLCPTTHIAVFQKTRITVPKSAQYITKPKSAHHFSQNLTSLPSFYMYNTYSMPPPRDVIDSHRKDQEPMFQRELCAARRRELLGEGCLSASKRRFFDVCGAKSFGHRCRAVLTQQDSHLNKGYLAVLTKAEAVACLEVHRLDAIATRVHRELGIPKDLNHSVLPLQAQVAEAEASLARMATDLKARAHAQVKSKPIWCGS